MSMPLCTSDEIKETMTLVMDAVMVERVGGWIAVGEMTEARPREARPRD